MRLAVIGDGRMGRAVATLAEERGWIVTAVVGAAGNAAGAAIDRPKLGMPDVAIEFTEASAAPANILACARAGIPVVVGTTGWYGELETVAAEVSRLGGSMLYAANFSLGAQLLRVAVITLAKLLRSSQDWDVHLVETHHLAKKDAPSGTAAALAAEVARVLERPLPVTSVRVGSVPGQHEVICDAPFESLRLAHEVRDRRVFAAGALAAAEWLQGRRGVYTVSDMLVGRGYNEH
jgi:4-hydroxy-tetrahydrodipicolinate reductase